MDLIGKNFMNRMVANFQTNSTSRPVTCNGIGSPPCAAPHRHSTTAPGAQAVFIQDVTVGVPNVLGIILGAPAICEWVTLKNHSIC